MKSSSDHAGDILRELTEHCEAIRKKSWTKRLEEAGLTQKEYSPSEPASVEYPFAEPSVIVDGPTKHYRIVYDEVTEEELKQIERLKEAIAKAELSETSKASKIFRTVSYAFAIILFVVGLFFAISVYKLAPMYSVMALFGFWPLALLLFGLAETHRIIEEIRRNSK